MEIITLMNPHLYAQCAMRLTKLETLLDQRKVYLGTLKGGGASDKEPTGQYRRHKNHGFNPWVRKIPWKKNDNALLYSCLVNPMDRGT